MYLCDSNSSTTDELVEEAIATLEHCFDLMNKDDLYTRSRPLVISYLALIAVKKDRAKNQSDANSETPDADR